MSFASIPVMSRYFDEGLKCRHSFEYKGLQDPILKVLPYRDMSIKNSAVMPLTLVTAEREFSKAARGAAAEAEA